MHVQAWHRLAGHDGDALERAVRRDGDFPQPGGESWRADVLCTRGAQRVYFEVQRSGITLEALHTRQARYRASDVHGVWFTRTHERALRGAQPWQRETPALYVTEQHQVPALGLSLEATVEATLGGHLDLFLSPVRPVQVTVLSETIGCFRCAGNTGLLVVVWLCPPNSPDLAVMLPGTTACLAAWVHGLLGPAWGGEHRTFTEWPREKPRVYTCPGCGRTRQARIQNGRARLAAAR